MLTKVSYVIDLPFLYHSDGRLRHSDVTARFRKLKATPADVVRPIFCPLHNSSSNHSLVSVVADDFLGYI